jgi:hypothetical protein
MENRKEKNGAKRGNIYLKFSEFGTATLSKKKRAPKDSL